MAASYAKGSKLEGGDIGVIVAYFVIVISFGLWSSLKNRGSIGGYFLAGRSMNFVLVGASLFASNIGSGHFIGLAGSGASSGIGIAVFELNAIFVLMLLGWVFVPVYIASGVFTMPEYLRKRLGGRRIGVYLALLALLLSIFTKVAADLYAGAIFLEQALGWNLYGSIIALLLVAALFTIGGGLTAVIWTDFIQTIIMIIGAIWLMIASFVHEEIGGYQGVRDKYFSSVRTPPNNTYNDYLDTTATPYNYSHCGHPPGNAFHLFRSASDSDLPWPGITFGLTISAVWYWCTDQVIVQRALASKNLVHAKGGTLVAGYLKFLPMWLIVVPGMISRILFTDQVACVEPEECKAICGQTSGCTNIAYPLLVLELMPTGARGLMLAVMLAALLSSLTSVFNSSSTLFTMDIWSMIRPHAQEWEQMIVGRVFVLFMVAIGVVWIPIVQNFAELFHYIQSVTSYLSPPICAIYVLAVFWKRLTEPGAFWSLMAGLAVGLTRFIWENVYSSVSCGQEGEDKRPAIIKDVHYLHFGIILFSIVFIMAIIISLLTTPIDDKHLHRLLFWNRHSTQERECLAAIDDEERKKKRLEKDNGVDTQSEQQNQPEQFVSETSIQPEIKEPCWKVSMRWVCGIEKHPELELTEEQKNEMNEKATSLYEATFWRRIVNINAIVLMVLTAFYWGFFY